MKGIIFDIKQFAVHDGPGIRTTVFFKACPLSCAWCHNPESRDACIAEVDAVYKIGKKEKIVMEKIGTEYSVDELLAYLLKDIHVMEESSGGVTISGGEPLSQFEFLKTLLFELKRSDIHTCVDTTGYANGNRIEEILPYTDLFLFDLKHYDEKKHIEYTGVSLEPIVNNLNKVLENNRELHLRIPVIPGINDSHEDKYGFLFKIQDLLKKPDQIHLLPYHNIADNKYVKLKFDNHFKNVPSLDPDRLSTFKIMLERAGYEVKIGA